MVENAEAGTSVLDGEDLVAAIERRHPDLPPRGSVIERVTGRVVPVDEHGRVLLMFGCEPSAPEAMFWFTIGGGVDDGETVRAAACRELAEEAGVVVPEESLGDPVHESVNEFDFAFRRLVSHDSVFAVAMDSARVISSAGWDATEQMTTAKIDWVDPAVVDLRQQGAGPAALADQVFAAVTAVRALGR